MPLTTIEAPSRLWFIPERGAEATQATGIDTSKPCLFVLGGEDYLCRGMSSAEAQHQAVLDSLSATTPFHFYTLTDDDPAHRQKSTASHKEYGEGETRAAQNNLRYNADPQNYYSPDAAQFVARYLMPLVESLVECAGEERKAALASTQKRFGAITFFGYSYGNVLVQEIRNALCQALPTLGYEKGEVAAAIGALSAVNISPSFRYAPKYPDITQTTFVWGKDKDSCHVSNLSLSSPFLEFNYPSNDLAWAQRDNHSIVYVKDGSNRLRSLHIKPNADNFHWRICCNKHNTPPLRQALPYLLSMCGAPWRRIISNCM